MKNEKSKLIMFVGILPITVTVFFTYLIAGTLKEFPSGILHGLIGALIALFFTICIMLLAFDPTIHSNLEKKRRS